ncbi:MAG: hypothetical protein C0606_03585 [Hyphomicrobiales bacterium]|nr:MAG: hypothetical protein C0606_03585 [Hyphomicrobiales bacterium]
MASLEIVYWRDIPAQVIVRAGRKAAKRPLGERFVAAIDRCAMRTGAADTDAYLAEWRRGAPHPVEGDLEALASEAEARIEAEYDTDRLNQLVAAGGREPAAIET